MLEFSKRTNTLEQTEYKYSLQDVAEPHLYRSLFNYDEAPKIPFNHRHVPMRPPEEIWITDSTFRDGQQAREPYTVEQIVDLYKMLHRLGGPKGIIRQTEFFLYSEKDKEAVRRCMELGYRYPEITGWIRAVKQDFQLVKEMGLKETGILASCSDYHIFKKLKMTRRQAMDQFLSIVKEALAIGIVPRVHLEDVTRADFYGFVVPFCIELMNLSQESGIPIKVRACDTLGFGVSYPGVALPRSVPGIIYGLWHHAGVPSEQLEWHGHNDFYKAVANAGTAWLYGCSGVNTTLLGIGERTGNCPLEAMVFEYAALRGTMDGMEPTVITEIAEYYTKVIGYNIPPMTPLVGKEFNFTRAGIHADGLLKDEEIYNIFNTEKLLNRPVVVAVNEHSGAAGLAHWVNRYFNLKGDKALDKKDPRLLRVKEWVDAQYAAGRNTVIGDNELEQAIRRLAPELMVELTGNK
ncbi:MAG TPA: 2-isopropylmalate synthase [Firmicutes bacterium]|nr:2-isopropylmalate synthase [Bacillota bacterium]HOQ25010.1 2-isopropylmalate synthase [Bacillota bacterium]HPT66861.1 2-isopropylmalate synthase [Bacillota bacterium]